MKLPSDKLIEEVNVERAKALKRKTPKVSDLIIPEKFESVYRLLSKFNNNKND